MPFPAAEVEDSIPGRFERQVAAWPDRPAVRAGGATVSYRELNARANRIARGLLESAGEGPEPVAILLPQGAELIAAVLGVLKAGRPYVGLDAAYPTALLRDMIVDAAAPIVLADVATSALLSASALPGVSVVRVDDPRLRGVDGSDPGLDIPPDRLAYLFYTSGSTGRPKGVVDSHRNVLHNVMRYTNTLRIGPTDRMTLLQTASFSGSVSSLFGAVLNGACSLPLDLHATGPAELARWLVAERITIYHSVPAVFRTAFAHGELFPDLRVVRLEGDQAAMADVRLFASHVVPEAVLVNGLGTTETGLVSQFFVSPGEAIEGAVLPVGYAVPDMEVSIVGDDRSPLPVGDVGEIAVRSRYLAVGYRGDPERTAERFLTDPEEPDRRTYLTGDVGRLRPDGCLEHLGRKGRRVKVRGHTVELADVELALMALPGVGQAAAVLDERDVSNPRIVGYWVSEKDSRVTTASLRATVRAQVAPHMVPGLLVELSALPLTSNGKVDRDALPAPAVDRPDLPVPYEEPQNLLERQLATIWGDLLRVSPVGIHDDFLELGGDSLAAMQLLTRIAEDLEVEVATDWILSESTVRGLADRILGERPTDPHPVVCVQEGDGHAPLFYVHGDYLTGGYYCRKLARAMGPEVRFLAVTPSGLDGRVAAASYAHMARIHLNAIRDIQPEGPYHLGGTCNGGLVAFEIARLLESEGERVATLALFAASAGNVRFGRLRRAIDAVPGPSRKARDRLFAAACRVAASAEGRGAFGFVGHAARSSGRLFPGRGAGSEDSPATGGRPSRLRAHYLRLDREYVPGRYGGRVVLLWPDDEPESGEAAAAWWRRVATDVELVELRRSHLACLTTEVAALGRALRAALRGPNAQG